MEIAFIFCLIIFMLYYIFIALKFSSPIFYYLGICIAVYSVVFFGFRGFDATPDTLNYIDIISNINENEGDFEYLSVMLFKFLNYVSDSYSIWFVLMFLIPWALINISVFSIFDVKGAVLCLLLITVSFSYFDLASNVNRQYISLSCFILGLASDFKKQVLFRNILFVIAVLFHFSALIALVVFIISLRLDSLNSNVIDKILVLWVVFLSTLALLGTDLSSYVIEYIKILSLMLDNTRTIRVLDIYSNLVEGSFYTRSSVNILIELIALVTPCFLIFHSNFQSNYRKLMYVYILSASVYLMLAFQAWSLRYSYLPFSLSPIIWVLFIQQFNSSYMRMLISLSIAIPWFSLYWYELSKLRYYWVF
ncbi:EpsG family protein [Aeromonas caviae]|uniref:EpsG family protein n=1 Tax=Aeromonas caviae TaxID=648 RepID=UPI003753FC36